MTTHRILNLCLAALIAAIMSMAYMLYGPSELEAAQEVADDLADAELQARAFAALTNKGYLP